ncbi:putative lectin-like domain protein [Bajunvirus bajun]|uniref:receptor protein-tyrosine kinase n=1 Tax=Brevundimonas phage vB_BgoS-Bajun TaxID=2948594 RepID=A0A9E7N7M0_9CAUD|nr:putative lectin-like domain protein [Brevundimonas phage vB_BgoS-Bajun]
MPTTGVYSAAYTGAVETFVAEVDGGITFELWGGAGAGGSYGNTANTRANRRGGNGGFQKGLIPVVAGDVITVEVGQGGRKPTAFSPTVGGGPGGWPDGGAGGTSTTATIALGGGGGSTRLYKNGVLMAIAGAGGGGTGYYFGGSGGGALGSTDGYNTAQAAENGANSTGGSQTAGGTTGGASLKGADSPSPATAIATASAGGGGGYFGGGRSSTSGAHGGGGGGSNFAAEAVLNYESRIALTAADTISTLPPVSANAPAGTGMGGVSATTIAGIANGGDGYARLAFTASARTMGPTDVLSLPPIANDQVITVTAAGVLQLKLWGAGGAGGSYSGSTVTARRGGPGAFTNVYLRVAAGDVLRIKVGAPGQKGMHDSTPIRGGSAAYPDGGWSNRSAANTVILFGGGGGSTQVFKNNVLVAVAAGGGGCTGFYAGGAGGADTGQVGMDAVAANGTGGTQSAGGLSGGGYLQGGNSGANTASQTNGGSGGGGGYYGGGANRGAAGAHGAGGGGSSFLDTVQALAPSQRVGGNNTTFLAPVDADKPAGVGDGGLSTVRYDTVTHGGPGYAKISYIDELTTLGDVRTINFTGEAKSFYCSTSGVIDFKSWGAGGGGGISLVEAAGSRAGAGAHTKGLVPVEAGDVIKVEVGGGGKRVVDLATQAMGGWPDGGTGARGANSGAENYAGGGGGGSTRVYKNGVLIAVAGAGGGGDRGAAGSGGALVGYDGRNSGGGVASTGGSQTAGGSLAGGFLQGGNSVHNTSLGGGGGGGGYYGGGASGQAVCPGGGGSSWFNGSYVIAGSRLGGNSGNTGEAGGSNDVHYPGAPIAQGGLTQRASAGALTDGGNGYVRLELKDESAIGSAPLPVAADGTEKTVTVTTSGVMSVVLWGGGGGGSKLFNGSAPLTGAGAGFTKINFGVVPGDVIKFSVGLGGKRGVNAGGTTGGGGLGGWPDGGAGGAPGNADFGCAGGGGGSRVYKNGVLMGVAGGGGGSGGYSPRGEAGAGGGATGGDGPHANAGTGGSQTAGGFNKTAPSNVAYQGAALQGGKGSPGVATTPSAGAGGGGGGGYFGGGGGGFDSGSGGIYPGGGGGSGYINTLAGATGTTTAGTGTGGAAAGTSDPLYPGGGEGVGGVGDVSVMTNVKDGGNGAITYYVTPTTGGDIGTVTLTSPTGTALRQGAEVRYDFSGAAQTVVVPATGTAVVKAWAGGGGGGYNQKGAATNGAGASGGFITAQLQVDAGDVIKVEVGGGGLGGRTSAALGGWPDGGSGQYGGASGSEQYGGGGGGGSTRVYVNDVLQLVAGAAGGGFGPQAATPGIGWAGPGGGLTGGDGRGAYGVFSRGGTQIAGGNNGFDGPGSALQGGSVTTSAGGGGGGGWFGGSGGANASGVTGGAGGGGGSSWAGGSRVIPGSVTTLSGSIDAGPAGGSTDSKYQSPVGKGGLNRSTAPSDAGSPGQVHIYFDGLAPANASGATGGTISLTVPTVSTGVPANAVAPTQAIALTAPAGGVLVGLPRGPVGTITFFGDLTGEATILASATPAIPGLELRAELGGQGTIEAVTLVPLTDNDLAWTSVISATLVGEVDYKNTGVSIIRLTPPRFYLPGVAPGDPFDNDLVFNAPQGFGQEGVDVYAAFSSVIALTAPGGDPHAGALARNNLPAWSAGAPGPYTAAISLQPLLGATAGGDALAANVTPVILDLTPPGVVASGITIDAPAVFDSLIYLTAPTGTGEQGVQADADFDSVIALTPPVGDPHVIGYASADFAFRTITLTRPLHIVEGNAYLNITADPPFVRITPPQALTTYGASVLATILPAQIRLRAASAIASEGNIALAVGGLEDVPLLFTPLDGIGTMQPEVRFDPLHFHTVDGYVENGDDTQGPLRFKRSRDEGAVPTLSDGEIALNEADGVLFSRNGAGNVRQTPYGALQMGGFAPEGGVSGHILAADRSWKPATARFDRPIRLSPALGALVPLSNDPVGVETRVLPNTRTHYHPFFVPKQVGVDQLAINVAGNTGAAYLEAYICRWDGEAAGEPIVTAGFLSPGAGVTIKPVSGTLQPGWHVAVVTVAAVGVLQMVVHRSPVSLNVDFTPAGDPSGPANAPGAPLLPINGRNTGSWAILSARFTNG